MQLGPLRVAVYSGQDCLRVQQESGDIQTWLVQKPSLQEWPWLLEHECLLLSTVRLDERALVFSQVEFILYLYDV